MIVDIIRIAKGGKNWHHGDHHGDCTDDEAALEAARNAIDDLVEADRILALIAIQDAEAAAVNQPHLQWLVDLLIREARRMFNAGIAKQDEGKPTQAIMSFRKAWVYAQAATKYAEMESKKHGDERKKH